MLWLYTLRWALVSCRNVLSLHCLWGGAYVPSGANSDCWCARVLRCLGHASSALRSSVGVRGGREVFDAQHRYEVIVYVLWDSESMRCQFTCIVAPVCLISHHVCWLRLHACICRGPFERAQVAERISFTTTAHFACTASRRGRQAGAHHRPHVSHTPGAPRTSRWSQAPHRIQRVVGQGSRQAGHSDRCAQFRCGLHGHPRPAIHHESYAGEFRAMVATIRHYLRPHAERVRPYAASTYAHYFGRPGSVLAPPTHGSQAGAAFLTTSRSR